MGADKYIPGGTYHAIHDHCSRVSFSLVRPLALALAGCAVSPLAATSDDLETSTCKGICPALVCDTAIKCAPGYHSVDSDGDGCADNCEPN